MNAIQVPPYEVVRVVPTNLSDADKRRQILDGKIEQGRTRALHVIETVQRDVPTDQIAKASALKFEPDAPTPAGSSGIVLHAGGVPLTPSAFALGQVAERAGVPVKYLRELNEGGGWKTELAAHALNEHLAHSGDRVLLRSVRGQLRGFLSDKFRRLDARPLIEALASEAQAVGAIPIDGVATDTRVALKLIDSRIDEPVPGEFVVYGLQWSTSDYGNGTHAVSSFALRVVCLNGATGENLLKQIHLGGRLADNIEFSNRTLQLDTRASVSALRDVVRGTLTQGGRERVSSAIRAANAKGYSGPQLKTVLAKQFNKDTVKSIVDAYESPDIINLPAGDTAWRASNAISWIARNTKDDEVRLDLERAAGALV